MVLIITEDGFSYKGRYEWFFEWFPHIFNNVVDVIFL